MQGWSPGLPVLGTLHPRRLPSVPRTWPYGNDREPCRVARDLGRSPPIQTKGFLAAQGSGVARRCCTRRRDRLLAACSDRARALEEARSPAWDLAWSWFGVTVRGDHYTLQFWRVAGNPAIRKTP